MPPRNRKKKFTVKFELTPKGLVGAAVVCLCIFLWMFLLGVRAGQTVFRSSPGPGKVVERKSIKNRPVFPPVADNEPAAAAVTIKRSIESQEDSATRTSVPESKPDPEEDPSFFSVQVAAYKDAKLAERAVSNWRSKGYEVFSRPPQGENDSFTRVFIGRFHRMDEAKKQEEILKKKENQKPFIALIPGER